MGKIKTLLTKIWAFIVGRLNVENQVVERVYFDLTPDSEIKNGAEYFSALQWALSRSGVNNIALSGPYGAGKSSVINSFLKKNPKVAKRTVKLSLAAFGEGESSEDEIIENGVLRQLFYRVSFSQIPQSRYRKIHKRSIKEFYAWTLCVALLIFGGLYVFDISKVTEIIDAVSGNSIVGGIPKWAVFTIISTIILMGAWIVSKFCFWFASRINNVEINLFDKARINSSNNDESVFDKNLDEIVYFFEKTGYSIVIIEDLDRFNNPEIYTKLRELNILLNNYEPIKKKNKRIVFIYAIRDDMFSDTERTKFFDFIIPIVPYINSTNSGDILLRKLKDLNSAGEAYSISEVFITKVSPFINDMRILSSIINEFVIYKNTIVLEQKLELNDEKMLSLMIFKNMHPDIFSEMECEDGLVRKAFDEKKIYVEKEIAKLEKDLSSLLNKLNVDTLSQEERVATLTNVDETKKKVNKLRWQKLASLLKAYSPEAILSDDVLECKLLVFFLRNGYIDETYANYINYFHPDSINAEENSFLVNLRTLGGVKDYSIHMPNVSRMCSRIDTYEFSQIEILNFDLVDYVVENGKQEKKKNDYLISLLSSRQNATKDFIVRYFMRGKNLDRIIQKLAASNRNLWDDILEDEEIDEWSKQVCFCKIIEYADCKDIVELNGVHSITEYFLSNVGILHPLSEVDVEKVENVLKENEILFSDVMLTDVSEALFDVIVDGCLYEINDVMLQRIVERINPELLSSFATCNYGTLLSLGNTSVLDYINDCCLEYIDNVFLSLSENTKETPANIIELLSNIEFDEEISLKVLEHEEAVFPNIDVFLKGQDNKEKMKGIIDYCLCNNRVSPDWKNIDKYIETYELSEDIRCFLTRNIEVLLSYSPDTIQEDTVYALLNSNDIENEIFVRLVGFLKNHHVLIDVENISEDKLEILIEQKYIAFSREIYQRIMENYPGLIEKYVVNNITPFIDEIDELECEASLLTRLFKYPTLLTDEQKGSLLEYIGIDNFTKDVSFFIESTDISIEKEFVLAAWENELNNKYEFLLKYIDSFTNEELSEMFDSLDHEHQLLADRSSARKVQLHKDGYNERLVIELKRKNYITSYREEVHEKTVGFLFDRHIEKEELITCRIKVKR